MISEPLAEASDLRVGTAVTIRILTLDQIARFGSGVGDPKGPILRLWVVGIARMPAWGGPLSEALASPAFAQRYRGTAASRPAFVRLDDTPEAADRFAQAYAAAAAEAPPSQLAAFLPPRVYRPRADGDPAARAAERTLVVGLTIFAAVLAAGGLLVVGQGLLRHHAAHRASQEVERALGLTPGERVAARLAAAGRPPSSPRCSRGRSGWRRARCSRWAARPGSSRSRGSGRRGGSAVGGALATALAFLALVAVAAAAAGRRAAPPRGPPARAGRPGPGWGPRRSSGCAWPCGATARAVAVSAGAAVAVAGIVAALAFGSGIALLLSDPGAHRAGRRPRAGGRRGGRRGQAGRSTPAWRRCR